MARSLKPSACQRLLASALCAALVAPVAPAWAAESQAPRAPHVATTQAAAFQESYNRWGGDYSVYCIAPRSYLHVLPSGALQRVEYLEDGGRLIAETLSADLTSVTESLTVSPSSYYPTGVSSAKDLLWGAFFSGKTHNYVVTGQENPTESASCVVYRVTQFDKSWKYLRSAEFKGENTTVPFEAGSCVLAEADGKLYLRTCHEMYMSSDGLNHQANVHIVLNESDLSTLTCETFVMNQLQTEGGYVSHSFNQKLAVGKGAVFGLDHGDAYPRAITLKRLGDTSKASVGNIVTFDGPVGMNSTGGTVGGFEYSGSTNNLLAVGSLSDDYTSSWSESPYNVWLTVTSASNLASTSTHTVAAGFAIGTSATTPQLVKVNDNRFLVLWGVDSSEERYSGGVYYQFYDGAGKSLGPVMHMDAELSDCQPVIYNGRVVWYASGKIGDSWVEIDGEQWLYENSRLPTQPRFYEIDAQTGVEVDPGEASDPTLPDTPSEPSSPLSPTNPSTPDAPAEHPRPTLANPAGGDLAYWYPEDRDYWEDLGDHTLEGARWYVYRAGALRRNCWIEYRGDWYWVGANGEMFVGFHSLTFFGRTDTYWFNGKHDGSYGKMSKGAQFIEGSWYYFNVDSEYPAGAMLRNGWKNGAYYGADGRWRP